MSLRGASENASSKIDLLGEVEERWRLGRSKSDGVRGRLKGNKNGKEIKVLAPVWFRSHVWEQQEKKSQGAGQTRPLETAKRGR